MQIRLNRIKHKLADGRVCFVLGGVAADRGEIHGAKRTVARHMSRDHPAHRAVGIHRVRIGVRPVDGVAVVSPAEDG